MKTNLKIANEAVAKAQGILDGGQTKSGEFTVKIQNYSNTVATNLLPETQAKMLLEDTAKAICQSTESDWADACDILENFNQINKLNARI